MATTTIQATINNVDIPLFQALFEKFRVKMIVVDPQKLIEKHKKGLIKGHKSAEELFNEILSEDE